MFAGTAKCRVGRLSRRHFAQQQSDGSSMTSESSTGDQRRGFSGMQVFGITLAVMVATVLVTLFVLRTYIFPNEFRPVTLNQNEEQILSDKLERLESFGAGHGASDTAARDNETVTPERYSEAGTDREIQFTEKELNAMLARNTDLARRLAIDLSDDLASVKLLVPLDDDFPVLGGKTLKLSAGAEFAFRQGRPVVVLKGVSIMGVPLPNAWLGNLKNVDLVREFGGDVGFWDSFLAGIEFVKVSEGRLTVRFRE
jgi:hypothetical protein